jgi:hypothetical protein
VTTVDLTHAQAVLERLEAIEHDLGLRQNVLEAAAMQWYRAKRDKEKAHALAFLEARKNGDTVAESSAKADRDTALIGAEEEAEYEALRHVVRTLETRASIGQSILRAQGSR